MSDTLTVKELLIVSIITGFATIGWLKVASLVSRSLQRRFIKKATVHCYTTDGIISVICGAPEVILVDMRTNKRTENQENNEEL